MPLVKAKIKEAYKMKASKSIRNCKLKKAICNNIEKRLQFSKTVKLAYVLDLSTHDLFEKKKY